MSFLRKALGTIVELDDPAAPTAAPTGPAGSTQTPAIPAPSSGADATLQAALTRIALARKTVFSGMLDAAEQLRNVPGMSDMQRIQAAAAMGQATADTIRAAVQSHIADLGAEKAKFSREIGTAQTARVEHALHRAEAAENSVVELQRQIDELQRQIAANTTSAQEARASAAQAEAELSATVSTFDATYQAVEAFLVATRDSVVSALKK